VIDGAAAAANAVPVRRQGNVAHRPGAWVVALKRFVLRLPWARRLAFALRRSFPKPLEVLPRTPFSRFAMPLEHRPSRDLTPRWGASCPPIRQLEDWFRAHAAAYHALIREIRVSARALKGILVEFDPARPTEPAWHGVPYAPFDAAVLYTMIRTYRPAIYLEIGSGITTCFAHRAIRDSGLSTRIISIDPEPRARIDSICNSVIRAGLEVCDLEVFSRLQANDIVFFDGSHRSFMNSDVTVFFIDVLPSLKPGVIVHIHDVMLPYDYPDWAKNWYWNEQYMLAVYLMGHMPRLAPLAPTAFICSDPEFAAELREPMIDLGPYNDGWLGGGAMWFTARA
jgi:predicted O-methyltransferase YrrM